MSLRLRMFATASLALLFALSGSTAHAAGVSPSNLPADNNFWGNPGDYGNKGLADARTNKALADDEKARSDNKSAVDDANRAALDKSLEQIATVADLAKQALEMYKTLTEIDESMSPNYEPPGAPDIPSQCMEDPECKICYGDAQAKMNKTRQGLEKLRGIALYTHKMATQGEAFMASAGQSGGTVSGLGAQTEIQKVDASVAEFDTAARSKREELIGKVKSNLQDISACEKKFYKNDDWYNRYGFMYYQFMIAQYSNVP
jgi:hypothetical protein